MFLRGKTSKRKHPRVESTTTGKANPLYERTYTLKAINTMISTSSYHLLINPRANDLLSLLSIQGVTYASRNQLPIQGLRY